MLREIFEEKFVTGMTSAPNLPPIFSQYKAVGRVLVCCQWLDHPHKLGYLNSVPFVTGPYFT
jgi:hypothetical protein